MLDRKGSIGCRRRYVSYLIAIRGYSYTRFQILTETSKVSITENLDISNIVFEKIGHFFIPLGIIRFLMSIKTIHFWM